MATCITKPCQIQILCRNKILFTYKFSFHKVIQPAHHWMTYQKVIYTHGILRDIRNKSKKLSFMRTIIPYDVEYKYKFARKTDIMNVLPIKF